MSNQNNDQEFKKQLDDHYQWPANYLFKFIVPKGKENAFDEIFPPGQEVKFKLSSEGNYISISAEVYMHSSEEVMNIYRKAYLVEGIISL